MSVNKEQMLRTEQGFRKEILQRAVGWCEAAVRNIEGHFGAVSQERVDASASINEGGTAEDF